MMRETVLNFKLKILKIFLEFLLFSYPFSSLIPDGGTDLTLANISICAYLSITLFSHQGNPWYYSTLTWWANWRVSNRGIKQGLLKNVAPSLQNPLASKRNYGNHENNEAIYDIITKHQMHWNLNAISESFSTTFCSSIKIRAIPRDTFARWADDRLPFHSPNRSWSRCQLWCAVKQKCSIFIITFKCSNSPIKNSCSNFT